ncbi:GNAT family N-acetyltransferase [Erythrobacter sp. JK5]|nr:GNAT family N-acetyltransferase [Erythrobacter sp. JK5]
MDLANAPDLRRTAAAADQVSGRLEQLRRISVEQAVDPSFVDAWRLLSDRASEPNPFAEAWFVLPSIGALGDGADIRLLALYTGGELAGLISIGLTANYYGYPVPHAASWLHANAFCGAPMVARGCERQFWHALFGHFDRAPGRALFLHLPSLPTDGPLERTLQAVLAEEGRRSNTALEQSRAMLASDLSPEDYLARSMTAKKRKELRRQHKRLAEEGALTFERCDDADGLQRWIADFLALEAAGWKGEAGSALANTDATRAFFTATMAGAAQAGRLERLALRLDGRPIAMLANFVTPPGVYSFKTAFDERYARFSPGMLLQLENLALLDRDDIAWADSCAVEGHPMIERLWREKRSLTSRNVAIGGRVRRALFARLMAFENRTRSAA